MLENPCPSSEPGKNVVPVFVRECVDGVLLHKGCAGLKQDNESTFQGDRQPEEGRNIVGWKFLSVNVTCTAVRGLTMTVTKSKALIDH